MRRRRRRRRHRAPSCMRRIFEERILTGGGKVGPHLNDVRVCTISFFFCHLVTSFMCGLRNSVVPEERLRGGMGNRPNNVSSSVCFSAKAKRKKFASYPADILSALSVLAFPVSLLSVLPESASSKSGQKVLILVHTGHLVLGFEGLPSRPEMAFRTSDYNLQEAGGVIAVFTRSI